MSSFNTENFSFLDFTEMDEDMSRQVWECRNLPEIRKWMVNTDTISFSDHCRFIDNLRQVDKKQYYCIIYNGIFAGSINIQYETPECAERGIYLHPDFFGQNLAVKVCNEFYKYLRKNTDLKYITTKVLRSNPSSNKLESSLHAMKTSEDCNYNYYRLKLTKFDED